MDVIFEDESGEEICKHNNVMGFPLKVGEEINLNVTGDNKIWDIKILSQKYFIANVSHAWTISYPPTGISVNFIQRTFVTLIKIEDI